MTKPLPPMPPVPPNGMPMGFPGMMPPPPMTTQSGYAGNFMQSGFNQYYHPGGQGQNPDEMAIAAYDAEHGQGASQQVGMDTVRSWMKNKCGGDPGTGQIPSQVTPSSTSTSTTVTSTSNSKVAASTATAASVTTADNTTESTLKTYTKKEIKSIQKQMERWSADYRKTYKKDYKTKYPDKYIREPKMAADAKEYAMQMWNNLHPGETCPVESFKY